jgi:hypothetical protein
MTSTRGPPRGRIRSPPFAAAEVAATVGGAVEAADAVLELTTASCMRDADVPRGSGAVSRFLCHP